MTIFYLISTILFFFGMILILRLPRNKLRFSLILLLVILGSICVGMRRKPHVLELVHYHLGSKYFKELSYDKLYFEILRVLNSEYNKEELKPISAVRDLENYRLIFPIIAQQMSGDRSRVWSEKRWMEFRGDVLFFDKMLRKYSAKNPFEHWAKILRDHGYNPPPTYTAYTLPLFNALPLNYFSVWLFMGMDILLILLAVFLIYRAFGLRSAAMMFIFMAFSWDMLAYLTWALFRFDWFFSIVLGIFLLKKKKYFLSGLGFSLSIILRLFPLVIVSVIAGFGILNWINDRKFGKNVIRFVTGVIAGSIILVGISTAILSIDTGKSPQNIWRDYSKNIALHNKTITLNHVGNIRLVQGTPGRELAEMISRIANPTDSDKRTQWETKLRFFSIYDKAAIFIRNHDWIGFIISVILVSLLFLGNYRRGIPLYRAAIYGILAIPIFIALSHYYYICLGLLFCLIDHDKIYNYLIVWILIIVAATNISWLYMDLAEDYEVFIKMYCNNLSIALFSVPIVTFLYRIFKKDKRKLTA